MITYTKSPADIIAMAERLSAWKSGHMILDRHEVKQLRYQLRYAFAQHRGYRVSLAKVWRLDGNGGRVTIFGNEGPPMSDFVCVFRDAGQYVIADQPMVFDRQAADEAA
jgi:hypothetical protein